MFTRLLLVLGAVSCGSAFLDDFHIFSSRCRDDEYLCADLKCIAANKRCDGFFDCGDQSDEQDCGMYLCQAPSYFKCKNERCIEASYVCNGENDCEDFSDEENCNFTAPNSTEKCEEGEWQCTNKRCIPKEWVCNQDLDCEDGSDESLGCSSHMACDGFKCKNGHCIVKEWRCDGNDDCMDNSDEQDCDIHVDPHECTWESQRFLCADNKTCVSLRDVCNGHAQCPDGSDESPQCNVPNMSCNNHRCPHDCIQLPTGPQCVCPKGYRNLNDDNNNCQDINECETYGVCDQGCRNTPGSYECYCQEGYVLQQDRRGCKVRSGEPIMFFSSKSEIRAYLLKTQVYFSVAKNLKQVVGVNFDGEYVYWTDIFAEHESVARSLKDGRNREVLITAGLGAPEDLDIDWVTGNIYFTDAEMQHIGVCTHDGARCTVLVNQDVHKPRGIALNPTKGEMYWTDWGERPEIARAMMDGTKDVSFVHEDIHWPNGLTIDFPNDRLYWTDAKFMTLESISLDGTGRRVVLKGVVKHPYAIAVFEDKLFWSDWATHSVQSCDKFTGKDHHTLIKEKKDLIYGISIYHPSNRLHPHANPCDTAFCSDICLLSGTSYTCACPQDRELSFDGHTCKDIDKKQVIILGAGNMLIHVEHQLLGKHDVTALPFLVKDVAALAYDSVHHSLYISDVEVRKIIRLNLHDGVAAPLPLEDLGKVVAMDFDNLGNNLYWCDEEKSTVEVMNLNTKSTKVLLHDLQGEIPESIAVVPEEGVMYVAFQKQSKRETHVDRFFMDGTGRTHPLSHGLIGPVNLLYDPELHRVFISDAGTGNIESTNIEGNDRHGFRALQASPIGITSLKSDLFWVTENSRRLYWANKLNSDRGLNKKITLDIPEEVERMRIVAVTPRRIGHSPCQHNNGNCSHICLHSQKNMVCACPVGTYLQADNHTCSKRAECTSDEFLCIHSNTCVPKNLRCNGKKDCGFGEDEEGCKRMNNQCPPGYFQCTDGDCIQEGRHCDFHYDCKDHSDEHNCSHAVANHCPPEHFKCNDDTCIMERFLCDGNKDCNGGEDENNCLASACLDVQFRCASGTCIPKDWECDHEYDCSDLSDEHSGCRTCPPELFACKNGKCVDKSFVCDHDDDCGDGSDEADCLAPVRHCPPGEFACTSDTSICLSDSARCNGSSECPHHEDEQNCSECHVEEFSCANKKCVPTEWLCDRSDDCGDNSDESPLLCSHSDHDIPEGKLQVPCDEGFRCKTGHCVDFSLVCNGEQDCYDGSDEGGVCQVACEGMGNPCSHDCVKTPFGPMCKCKPGFTLLGNGLTCGDVNECLRDPPLCSQLCLNEPGSFKCDCYDGFVLRSDKVSCKAKGQAMSMIYTQENEIRELSQMNNSLRLLFDEDTPKITGLDVDVRAGFIYFAIKDSGTLHRLSLSGKTKEVIEKLGEPQNIAVDWITKNVYYVNVLPQARSISVCNFDDKVCASLIPVDTHRQVSALAVDPVNDAVFYALISWWVFNSPTYVIYRTRLDGTQPQELVRSTAGFVTGLGADADKRELYFVDHHLGHLGKVNYDGTMNTRVFSNLSRPTGLSFFENHLYFFVAGGFMRKCAAYAPSACTGFKVHGSSDELFALAQTSKQPMGKNACANHSCSYLCVPSTPKYKCVCEDGSVSMTDDGDDCSSKLRSSNSAGSRLLMSPEHHSESLERENSHSGSIAAAILIPVLVLCFASGGFYVMRKRTRVHFNVRMRFHNPLFGVETDEEKVSVLEPGQHEYLNPVEFLEAERDAHQRDPRSTILVNV